MSRTAVFPGSFDPLHLGHLDIIERAAQLFDHLIVAMGKNSAKQPLYTITDRIAMAQEATKHLNNVEIASYTGLTASYCQEVGAQYLIRGMRSSQDADYELPIAHMNGQINIGLETVFLLARPEHIFLSSTILREVLRTKESVEQWVPWLKTRSA